MAKWVIDLKRSQTEISEENFPKPPGYSDDLETVTETNSNVVTVEAQTAAKQRQIMALAWSPGKSLLTTAFMLYMSGTSIQLFSIMTTGMALFTPVKAIAGIQDTFKEFKKEDGVDTRMPTLLYLGFQLLSLAVALYQCSRMGLLPVTSADWTSFIPAKNILEHSVFGEGIMKTNSCDDTLSSISIMLSLTSAVYGMRYKVRSKRPQRTVWSSDVQPSSV